MSISYKESRKNNVLDSFLGNEKKKMETEKIDIAKKILSYGNKKYTMKNLMRLTFTDLLKLDTSLFIINLSIKNKK